MPIARFHVTIVFFFIEQTSRKIISNSIAGFTYNTNVL